MAIEFDIKTAEGVSNLDRLTKAWDRNRDRVNTATAAYEKQTQRLGRSILENQKLVRSLNTLEGEYIELQKKTSGLSTTTKVLGNRVKILEAELSLLTAEMSKLSAANSKVNASTAKTVKSQTQLRSAFRGTAGALGGLWLAYGDILPMMAAFSASAIAKDVLTQGAAFRYTTKFITVLGEESGTSSISVEELRDQLQSFEGLRKGPQELAAGMKEFSKAGVSAVTALGDIEEMARFATIAELDMSAATSLIIGQANAFGETYSDSANMVTAAAMSSATSIQEMAQAMTNTTELGSISKVQFHEIATALAIMANNGIRGSKAGTALRTSIMRMQTPTKKLLGLMGDLNIEWSAFTEDGKVKSVKQMFTELNNVTKDLTSEKRIELFRELFGLRAMKGGANIIANIVDKFDEMDTKVREASEGVTLLQRTHEEMADTTMAKWDELGVHYEKFITGLKSSWVADLGIYLADLGISFFEHLDLVGKWEEYVEAVGTLLSEGLKGKAKDGAEDFAKVFTAKSKPAWYEGGIQAGSEWGKGVRDALNSLPSAGDSSKPSQSSAAILNGLRDNAINGKVYAEITRLNEAYSVSAIAADPWMNPKIQKERADAMERGLKLENEMLVKREEANLKAAKSMTDMWLAYDKGKLEADIRAENALQAKREEVAERLSRLHMSDKELALADLKERFDKETEYMDHTSILYQQLSEIYRYEADEIKGINFDLVKELKNHWDDFSDSLKSSLRDGLSQSFKVLVSGSKKYEQQLATIQGKIHQLQYDSLSSGVEQMEFLQREYDTTLDAALGGNESALQQYMDNLDTYLSKAKEEMDPQEYTQIYDQAMQDLDALNKEYSDNTKAKWAELKEVWGDLWDSMLDKLVDTLADMAVSWAASQVSSMFSGWKFHDGLWNLEDDELPAILQKGEMVIPATHAEQIRENLMGIGNGTGNVFDAVVAGTSLMDLTGWEDEFSDHLSSAYKDDYVAAALGTLASGSPLTGLLSFLGPQVGIQNTGQALAETGLDVMGIHGSWSDAGFMIGSVLSTMLMGGPLASVTGLNNLGGFVGAIAADMIGDALDAREFEAVRDELEENFNLTPSQQAQAVQSMEAFQAEWGRLSPVQSLATNISMMSSFTGANLGLNDLLASEKEARREELARAREDREQALREYSSYYEDTFGETYSGYYAPPGYTESKIDDALNDFFDEIDSISEGSSEGPGVGETGGGTPDHEPGGSFGMASGGVVDRLLVPRGEDGYMALQYGEGVVDRDTMSILSREMKSGGFSAVVAAIQELKDQLAAANFAIAKNTQDTAKLLRKMDAIGLGVRT